MNERRCINCDVGKEKLVCIVENVDGTCISARIREHTIFSLKQLPTCKPRQGDADLKNATNTKKTIRGLHPRIVFVNCMRVIHKQPGKGVSIG